MNTRLDENQTELAISILSILLQMTADVNSLLDQMIQILWQLGGQTGGFEDSENLVAGDLRDLWDSKTISENDTNLRGSQTFLSILKYLLLYLL